MIFQYVSGLNATLPRIIQLAIGAYNDDSGNITFYSDRVEIETDTFTVTFNGTGISHIGGVIQGGAVTGITITPAGGGTAESQR